MFDRAASDIDRAAISRIGPIHERRSLAANEHEPRRPRAALQQAHDGEVTLACECSDPSCREVISLTAEEVDFIRKVPGRLVVSPGHADPESERVVMAEPDRFEVVEPFGSGT
jgi:hypothetical protein